MDFVALLPNPPLTFSAYVMLSKKTMYLGMDSASLAVNCPCQACAIAQGQSHGSGRPDQDQDHNHPNDTHLQQGRRMDVPMRSFFPGTFYIFLLTTTTSNPMHFFFTRALVVVFVAIAVLFLSN